jgi:hypothetical protein
MGINHTKRNFSRKKVNALKDNVLAELIKSGFSLDEKQLHFESSKDNIRNLHKQSVNEMRNKYSTTLKQKEPDLLKYIANGSDIVPEDIDPFLMYVDSRTEHWNLFNYIKIHWSIPISLGYGRRLCYVVFDRTNNKAIGILGLADSVFTNPARDNHIGWTKEQKMLDVKDTSLAFMGLILVLFSQNIPIWAGTTDQNVIYGATCLIDIIGMLCEFQALLWQREDETNNKGRVWEAYSNLVPVTAWVEKWTPRLATVTAIGKTIYDWGVWATYGL